MVEENGVPWENHRTVTSDWQILSHNIASGTPCLSGFEFTTLVVIGTDCIGSYTLPNDHDHDNFYHNMKTMIIHSTKTKPIHTFTV